MRDGSAKARLDNLLTPHANDNWDWFLFPPSLSRTLSPFVMLFLARVHFVVINLLAHARNSRGMVCYTILIIGLAKERHCQKIMQ